MRDLFDTTRHYRVVSFRNLISHLNALLHFIADLIPPMLSTEMRYKEISAVGLG